MTVELYQKEGRNAFTSETQRHRAEILFDDTSFQTDLSFYITWSC